nr:hypothetical protein [candidate division Zixibacteria bacterium]
MLLSAVYKTRYILPIVGLLLIVACLTPLYAQEDNADIVIDGTPHAPDEIIRIPENSKLAYQIEAPEDTTVTKTAQKHEVFKDIYYIDQSGGNRRILMYMLSDSASNMLHWSEVMFSDKDYAGALTEYRNIAAIEPDFHHIMTLIGDAYFMMEQCDSSIYYFRTAINRNFIDFDAHWFLADALIKTGQPEEAVKEITIAHILNVYHEDIYKIMKQFRDNVGRPWKEWSFDPVYQLNEEGGTVHVRVREPWIGYAMVKAIWKYEPGYAEQMGIENHSDSAVYATEESEAILSYFAQNPGDDNLKRIISDGFLEEFIKYEIALRKLPRTGMLFSEAEFRRMIEYLDKYH